MLSHLLTTADVGHPGPCCRASYGLNERVGEACCKVSLYNPELLKHSFLSCISLLAEYFRQEVSACAKG
jgi:hypothetical protein